MENAVFGFVNTDFVNIIMFVVSKIATIVTKHLPAVVN